MIKIKLPYNRLEHIPELLRNYVTYLCTEIELTIDEDSIDILRVKTSIAGKLFEKFNSKLIKRYQQNNYTITLEIYEAIVVRDSMLFHVNNTQNEYSKSLANKILLEVDQQLSSPSKYFINI